MDDHRPKLNATAVLVIANIIVFVAEFVVPDSIWYFIQNQALSTSVVTDGRWHTLLTSMFMHGDLMHIGCNMVTLYWVGTIIEQVYGPVRYLVIYFVSGIAGGLLFVAVNVLLGQPASCVGASGAIFGLFAAYGWLLWRERKQAVLFVRPTSKTDLQSIGALLVMNLLVSFAPGIAWEGHLGGFIGGAIVGSIFYALERKRVLARMAAGNQAGRLYNVQINDVRRM